MSTPQDDALAAAVEDYRRAYRERFGSYERFLKTSIKGNQAEITLPAKPLEDGTPCGMHAPIFADLDTLMSLAAHLRTK